MKPIPPTVSLPTWKGLYAAARDFHSLNPWELLGDLDLISVRDPSTGATGHGVVMGSAGQLFGFCLYRGAEGFDMYNRLLASEGDVPTEDHIMGQNCIKLEFSAKSELDPEDRRIIKQLNLLFKGPASTPQFRSMTPGYAPWFLTEEEAKFLTLGLRAACHHYMAVEAGEADECVRKDEILMHSPVADPEENFHTTWEPAPVFSKPAAPPILDISVINALHSLPTDAGTTWEVDALWIPGVILDRERPYFARMPAICDASTGFAFQADVAQPEVTPSQMLADAVCSVITSHGRKPGMIAVRSEDHAAALRPVTHALGIILQKKKQLKAIESLRESLAEFSRQRGR